MAESSDNSGNLLVNVLKVAASIAAIKGVVKVYQHYQFVLVDRQVDDLHDAFQTQPMLLTNGPHSVQIVDETGRAQLAGAAQPAPPPSATSRSPSTIRILSVTSRTPVAWIKEENRSGRYGAERTLSRVHLFMQPRWLLGPCLSPAGTKLEAYLRLHKIPYVVHTVNVLRGDDSEAAASVQDVPLEERSAKDRAAAHRKRQQAAQQRHRQLPFIIYRGEVVVDSFDATVAYLNEKFNIQPPAHTADATLSAVAHTINRTMEYTLQMHYRVGMILEAPAVFSRYAGPALGIPGWAMRLWVALPFFSGIRRGVTRSLAAHDLGALTRPQLEASFLHELQSLEQLLRNDDGKHPFLLGTEPTKEDCMVYAYLLPIVRLTEGDLQQAHNSNFRYIAESETINAYVQRLTELAFPDLDRLTSHLRDQKAVVADLARHQRAARQQRQRQGQPATTPSVARSSVAPRRDRGNSVDSVASRATVNKEASVRPAPAATVATKAPSPAPTRVPAAAAAPAPAPAPAPALAQPVAEAQPSTAEHSSAPGTPVTVRKARPSVSVPTTDEFSTLSASAIRKTRPARLGTPGASAAPRAGPEDASEFANEQPPPPPAAAVTVRHENPHSPLVPADPPVTPVTPAMTTAATPAAEKKPAVAPLSSFSLRSAEGEGDKVATSTISKRPTTPRTATTPRQTVAQAPPAAAVLHQPQQGTATAQRISTPVANHSLSTDPPSLGSSTRSGHMHHGTRGSDPAAGTPPSTAGGAAARGSDGTHNADAAPQLRSTQPRGSKRRLSTSSANAPGGGGSVNANAVPASVKRKK